MTRAEVIAIREALRGIGIDDVGDITDLGASIHVQVRGDTATNGQITAALASATGRAIAHERIPVRGGPTGPTGPTGAAAGRVARD